MTTTEREKPLTAEERAELAVLKGRYYPGDEFTEFGPEYDRFLNLWARYWHTLQIRVVFRALADALPDLEVEDSEICVLAGWKGRYEVTLQEVWKDGSDESDEIELIAKGLWQPPKRQRFALADPECFEKLAKALAVYDITLDLEAL